MLSTCSGNLGFSYQISSFERGITFAPNLCLKQAYRKYKFVNRKYYIHIIIIVYRRSVKHILRYGMVRYPIKTFKI